MIDKRIFYCWFGKNPLSELNRKCIESWKKYCPDYEIVKIDETNFDYTKDEFANKMYEQKNWAFVSDVARMNALMKESGFYLDTDMELFKPLDELRGEPAIVAQCGFGLFGNGILGRGEHIPLIYEKMSQKAEIGEALYERMNRLVYSTYNTHGGDIERYKDITLLGDGYVNINDDSKKLESTFARHHNECTWAKSWKGGFEMYSDLVPVRICTPKGRNKRQELETYNGKTPKGTLRITKDKATFKDLEICNLLNNINIHVVKMSDTLLISDLFNKQNKYECFQDNQNNCTVYVKK